MLRAQAFAKATAGKAGHRAQNIGRSWRGFAIRAPFLLGCNPCFVLQVCKWHGLQIRASHLLRKELINNNLTIYFQRVLKLFRLLPINNFKEDLKVN